MDTTQTPQLPHQKIVGFKIWYSDSAYTSNDGKWTEAPIDDVQCVMVYFEKKDAMGRHTRLYSNGCDYYALDWQGNFTSHFDDVSKVEGWILLGKFMEYREHINICKKAFDDYGEWLEPKDITQLF